MVWDLQKVPKSCVDRWRVVSVPSKNVWLRNTEEFLQTFGLFLVENGQEKRGVKKWNIYFFFYLMYITFHGWAHENSWKLLYQHSEFADVSYDYVLYIISSVALFKRKMLGAFVDHTKPYHARVAQRKGIRSSSVEFYTGVNKEWNHVPCLLTHATRDFQCSWNVAVK